MSEETLREPRPSHTKPDKVYRVDPIAYCSFDKEIKRICREEWLATLTKL